MRSFRREGSRVLADSNWLRRASVFRRSADKIGLRCTGVPASGLDRTQKTQVRFRIHLNGFIAQPAAIETAGYGGELISWPVNPVILCYNRTIMQKRMV